MVVSHLAATLQVHAVVRSTPVTDGLAVLCAHFGFAEVNGVAAECSAVPLLGPGQRAGRGWRSLWLLGWHGSVHG